MSRIRIRNPGQDDPPANGEGFYPAQAVHSYGTTIELDGRELKYVRAVSFKAEVDHLVRVDVELLVSDLDVELNADVHVNAVVQEPGLVEVERSDDGKTQRIRFIPSRIGPGGYPLKDD